MTRCANGPYRVQENIHHRLSDEPTPSAKPMRASRMRREKGIWIWFVDGRILCPFPAWEVSLLASKYRCFPIYNRQQRWVKYGEWYRLPLEDVTVPPDPVGFHGKVAV